jgi:hypothetical protein
MSKISVDMALKRLLVERFKSLVGRGLEDRYRLTVSPILLDHVARNHPLLPKPCTQTPTSKIHIFLPPAFLSSDLPLNHHPSNRLNALLHRHLARLHHILALTHQPHLPTPGNIRLTPFNISLFSPASLLPSSIPSNRNSNTYVMYNSPSPPVEMMFLITLPSSC